MDIKTQLDNALKDAMRSGDTLRKNVIRMALAAVKQAEVDRQTTLDDLGVIAILQKQVKMCNETRDEALEAGRADLAAGAEAELEVLEAFLPKAMSEDELHSLAEKAIAETGASGPADMGKVMKVMIPQVAGRADGSQISQVVRSLLQK
jgi:uncharacterized protein YqeY